MDLNQQFDFLKNCHTREPYPDLQQRKEVLRQLVILLQTNAHAIAQAISKDFSHRSETETLFLEVFPTIKAIKYCLSQCKKWMKTRKRHVSWLFLPAQASLIPQPLGVVGNMVPWNYPLYLALVPTAYALAAGNRVMVKMSELSEHVGQKLEQLLNQATYTPWIQIVNGDVEVSKEFAKLRFGHLIFTGSTPVGKQVMRAASENLTPVTLELGGKSPAILSRTMNPHYFQRLFMGKLFNAGQTCIAPDYLIAPKEWESRITEHLKSFLEEHYPRLMQNPDYTSIISPGHKERLLELIEDARQKGAKVLSFGELKAEGRRLPVHLIFDVTPEMKVMQEEIFGPVLPVKTYTDFKEAVSAVNELPNPLALYYFGADKTEIEMLKLKTLSGALSINETVLHIAIDDLPFGGVGYSGIGYYHGQEGFDTFSKLKPIFIQRRFSPIEWLYPPYGKLMGLFLKTIGRIAAPQKR